MNQVNVIDRGLGAGLGAEQVNGEGHPDEAVDEQRDKQQATELRVLVKSVDLAQRLDRHQRRTHLLLWFLSHHTKLGDSGALDCSHHLDDRAVRHRLVGFQVDGLVFTFT